MKKICYIVTVPITIKAFFIPQLKYCYKFYFENNKSLEECLELIKQNKEQRYDGTF